MHVKFGHDLEHHAQASHVVVGVHRRMLHAFAHGLVRGKMNGSDKGGPTAFHGVKHRSHCLKVAAIDLEEWDLFLAQSAHRFHGLDVGIGEVVQKHRIVACFMQCHGGVAADVPRASGDQNCAFPCQAHGAKVRMPSGV